jgi:hypothetical protein
MYSNPKEYVFLFYNPREKMYSKTNTFSFIKTYFIPFLSLLSKREDVFQSKRICIPILQSKREDVFLFYPTTYLNLFLYSK